MKLFSLNLMLPLIATALASVQICNALPSPNSNRFLLPELKSLCSKKPKSVPPYYMASAEAIQFYMKEFGKQNPNFFVKINAAGKELLSTPNSHGDHQKKLEQFTFLLNSSQEKHFEGNQAWLLWKAYATPNLRSEIGTAEKSTCIVKESSAFRSFKKEFLKTYNLYFANSIFFKPQLDYLNKNSNNIFPSGHKAFFGATVSVHRGQNRLCLNPEESPLLLLPKVNHEAVHAINKQILDLKLEFYHKREKLVEARTKLESSYDALVDFEDYLTADSPIDIDTMTEAIPDDLSTVEAKKFIEGDLRRRIDKAREIKSPFKGVSEEQGQITYENLLLSWYTELGKKKRFQGKLLGFKARLDQQRFLDENRAYAHSLVSALHLLKHYPNDFCRILVPSFQAKKPVLFYEAYLELEGRIQSGSLGKFIAESYISQGAYLEAAILNQKKEIKEDLKKGAKQILYEIFSSYGLAGSKER